MQIICRLYVDYEDDMQTICRRYADEMRVNFRPKADDNQAKVQTKSQAIFGLPSGRGAAIMVCAAPKKLLGRG